MVKTKEIIAIILIVINLTFPIGVILMGSNDYSQLKTTGYTEGIRIPQQDTNQNVLTKLLNTIGNFFGTLYSILVLYFNAMYFIIPNAPPILSLVVVIFQIISALIVYLLIRGN